MRDEHVPKASVSAPGLSPLPTTQIFGIPRKPVPTSAEDSIPVTPIFPASPQDTSALSQSSDVKRHQEEVWEGFLHQATWRSWALRRRTLLTFAGIFLAIFASIEAIIDVSHRNNGIAYADEHDYYLWTYGPVAGMSVHSSVVAVLTIPSLDCHPRLLVPR